jgi:MinD superfamily P-loop ATPase
MEGTRIARRFDENLSMIAPSGYSVEHNPEKCRACRNCMAVCPFDAISFAADGSRLYDRAACMGCALCAERCEHEALTLVRDREKGDPLDLDFARATLGRETANEA